MVSYKIRLTPKGSYARSIRRQYGSEGLRSFFDKHGSGGVNRSFGARGRPGGVKVFPSLSAAKRYVAASNMKSFSAVPVRARRR